MKAAQQALLEAEHGVFVHWYDKEGQFGLTKTIERLEKVFTALKELPGSR